MSNFNTLSNLVQKVIKRLSLYPGTAVQTYAEDRIAEMIIATFKKLFAKRFWSFNTFWYKYELIGEDGVVKENVSKDIADFSNILSISSESNPSYSLKNLNNTTNPFVITGDTPSYKIRSNNPEKIFAVVPFTAKGFIYVQARSCPKEFYPETVIPFDDEVLISGVCADYVADDGNSSLQYNKFKQDYEERLADLMANDNAGSADWNDEEAYFGNNSWR